MTSSRFTHSQREQTVLIDLERCFPHFTGEARFWEKVPDGQDPPDFISRVQSGPIGLELIEWLDGDQMRPAKGRESQRDQIRNVPRENWHVEHQPRNFKLAIVTPLWGLRIVRSEEALVRREFFECAASADKAWNANPDLWAGGHYTEDFAGYPILGKYFETIHYIEGSPLGLCWIDVEEDGEAYDPSAPAQTLEQALVKKLSLYSSSSTKARLKMHGLSESNLLVHGGFNAYAYNTPSGSLSLADIAQRGAAFYAAEPQRQTFNRVWFFNSLDSADDLNQPLGFPPGYGQVRWLAQLWPTFSIHPASVPA
jgi:hypothetical protein